MPDHVHMAFTPLADDDGPISLHEIFQKVKSESAHKVNKRLGRSGVVWQHESFDHVLRHEESLAAKLDYMVQNPVRAGLVQAAEQYQWLWLEKSKCDRVGRTHTG